MAEKAAYHLDINWIHITCLEGWPSIYYQVWLQEGILVDTVIFVVYVDDILVVIRKEVEIGGPS